MKITVIYTKEPDGRVNAFIPALPGCSAWGWTLREARKSVSEVLGPYLEELFEGGEAPLKEVKEEVINI